MDHVADAVDLANQKPDEDLADLANPTRSSGTWPFSDSPRIAGWNHPQNL